jgi:hypothetical protein
LRKFGCVEFDAKLSKRRRQKKRMSFALGQTAFSEGLPQTAADARKPQRKQAFAMQKK